MDLLRDVASAIEKHALLSPGERVIVGVSGGADSLCLMHSLDQLGYEVIVAHLDHQLRVESGEDAAYVQEIATQHQMQFVMERVESGDGSSSIEEAGRIQRYSYFLRIAIKLGIKSIAVGHTADDQSETILMHFLRGTGPEGLRGMLPKRSMAQWGGEARAREIMLIRPLLNLPRSMIESYCDDVGLEPLHDPSNLDVSFARNRIRHELLPLLKTYNPGLDKALLRMADIMHAEVELVDEILHDAVGGLSMREEKNRIIFNRGPFLQLPFVLQRVFLRRFLGYPISQHGTIGFEKTKNALQFLRSSDAWGMMDLGNDLELERFSEKVVIRKGSASPMLAEYPQLISTQNLEPVASVTALGEGWALSASDEELTSQLRVNIIGNQDPSRAFLDAHVMRKSPFLRVQKLGERFQPLGMTGSIKLSDYFINKKIPRPARKNWPLYATDEEIFWVVGLQIAESFRIRANTKRILRLELLSI